MKLRKLTIRDLGGLRDRTLSFTEPNSSTPRPVTLITGPSCSGKTSLLRAIAAAKEAVGAYGAAPQPIDMVHPGPEARIDAEWGLSPHEKRVAEEKESLSVTWAMATGDLPEVSHKLREAFGRFSRDPDRPKIELFSSKRTMDTTKISPLLPNLPDELEGRSRLRDTPLKYAGILRAMNEAVLRQASETATVLEERGVTFRGQMPDSLAAYKTAVAKVCPSVRLHSVEPRERVRPLVWLHTKEGRRVELMDLADSELQGFLFACAFTWLGLNRSLILIDTPELHIHPGDHARFFQAICDLGRDNQIIAATSSPAVLASVSPDQIIDLARPPERSS